MPTPGRARAQFHRLVESLAWRPKRHAGEADIRRVLPDYRIAVIGSKRKTISRGERKGLATSETDTPQERAEKWTRFQAGEVDVVLLTYTALGRTRMNERAVRAYAEQTEAIQREVALRRRNAGKRKKLTERDEAILREGVAAWVAQQMELTEGWDYDPGVAWSSRPGPTSESISSSWTRPRTSRSSPGLEDLPEDREGGVPRFMGNPGDGSKRAWQVLQTGSLPLRRGSSPHGRVWGGPPVGDARQEQPGPSDRLGSTTSSSTSIPTPGRAWASASRAGLEDMFIDRYQKIEIKPVVTPKMEVHDRGAVVGFQNLHELRDVIFRYGEQ